MILLYFSIFKAADFDVKHELKVRMIENSKGINNKVVKNQMGNIITVGDMTKSLDQHQEILKINIMPIKSRKYEKHGDNIVKKESTNIYLSQKFRFHVHFNIPNDKQINTDFTVKKSLQDILNFHADVLSKFDRISYVSPLMIQLKNITDIFINYPQSITKEKIVTLEHLYVKISKNFIFFVTEFIKFVEINNSILENLISEKVMSNFTYCNDNIDKGGPEDTVGSVNIYGKKNTHNNINNISDPTEYLKSNTVSNSDFFSEVDQKSLANNDLMKTITFVNNVLTHGNFINLVITDIKNQNNLNQAVIFCEVKYFISRRPTVRNVNINVTNLIKYLETKKFTIHKELIKIIQDMKNLINKNGFIQYKKTLEDYFNEILNDMFYLDNPLFIMFEINKIMVNLKLKISI
jgi:hypothetical protein